MTERYIAVSPGTTKRIFVNSRRGVLLWSLFEGLNVEDFYFHEESDFIHVMRVFASRELVRYRSGLVYLGQAKRCLGASLHRYVYLTEDACHGVRCNASFQWERNDIITMAPL